MIFPSHSYCFTFYIIINNENEFAPLWAFEKHLCSALRIFVANSLVFGLSQWLSGKKNLPAMQETQVQSMGWEDPLEEGMATHPSVLAWRIPWTEEPCRLQFMGLQRIRHDRSDLASTYPLCSAEGHTSEEFSMTEKDLKHQEDGGSGEKAKVQELRALFFSSTMEAAPGSFSRTHWLMLTSP